MKYTPVNRMMFSVHTYDGRKSAASKVSRLLITQASYLILLSSVYAMLITVLRFQLCDDRACGESDEEADRTIVC
jgi:hypothetical protein